MLGIRVTLLLALSALLAVLAAPAGAAVKMYEGKWVADAFGNDKVGLGGTASQYFSALNNPQGVLCNGGIPICNLSATPVTSLTSPSLAEFGPLGPNCAKLSTFMGGVTTVRPAKGYTLTVGGPGTDPGGAQAYVGTIMSGVKYRSPPLYRNQAFFTPSGNPNNATACAATTTVGGLQATDYLSPFDPQRGPAQAGAPVSGVITASVDTAMASLPFTFAAAPTAPPGGMRRTTLGSFSNTYPYLYSYTYRTLRNGAGNFKRGGGFFTANGTGTFVLAYGQNTRGKAVVKAGANRFGGVMRLLGPAPELWPLSTVAFNGSAGKVCFFNSGCSLGGFDWRYRFAGTYTATGTGMGKANWNKAVKYATVNATSKYYNTQGMTVSLVTLDGWRFPWTTGTVTVTATGRGPHKTYIQRKGFDNRTSKGGGTIQLVTPIVTRWLQPSFNFETSGVAVMRLPEPHKWALLVAGLSVLGLLYRARGR